MIETEDTSLICEFIVLDNTLKFLTIELEAVEKSSIKIKKSHYDLVYSKINKAHKELMIIHKQLRQRGIKIHDMEQTYFGVLYPYSCRGYFKNQEIQRDALRNRVRDKLGELYR